MDENKDIQLDPDKLESMNYNDRPDGYGFGEAESRDHTKPYEEDEYFNDRTYDLVRGYCGRSRGHHGRDWNRWRFDEPHTRDEFGLRNQYGPVDQYSFRDIYIRQFSQPTSSTVYDTLRDFRGVGPKGYTPDDKRIQEDVCQALLESPEVDASEISVEVENACVYLRGEVEYRSFKKAAEQVVEKVSGVRNIQNEIRVRRWF
jgi:hypothetical protein